MKKLSVASVGLMALALQPAAAAEVPYGPPPVMYAPAPAVVIFTWTGFYFGAHGGGLEPQDRDRHPLPLLWRHAHAGTVQCRRERMARRRPDRGHVPSRLLGIRRRGRR